MILCSWHAYGLCVIDDVVDRTDSLFYEGVIDEQ